MRNHSKLLLAGLCASFMLAAAVATASANHLSVNELSHRITWRELVFEFGGNRFSCEVTLEGRFHSATIAKVAGALIGYVNGANVGTCRGGSIMVHRETLPWHEQYNGFTGVLPRIETIRVALVGMRFRFHPEASTECEGGTTQTEPGFGRITIGALGEANRIDAEGTIRLRGNFLCEFASMTFSGSGSVTTPTGGRITVRLI